MIYPANTIRRHLWWRRRRLNFFDVGPGDRVLDLGCGDGLDSKLWKELGIKQVVGLDVVGFDKVSVVGSAKRLPFRDGAFDVVWADSVMYQFRDYGLVLGEIKRVLKSGGRFCFVDMHNCLWRRVYNWWTLVWGGPRKRAYLAERQAIQSWSEAKFIRSITRAGLLKEWVRVDYLSLVGQYRK